MPNIVDPTIPNYPPQGIQAQLDLLYLYNPDVAQKLIDQLNAGLADMEAFKKELEKALQDLQGVLRYKGSVETEADLPTEGNVIGDVWNITSTDENVAWNGTEWDKFGSAIDTSVFLTKTDAANTYLPLSGGTLTADAEIGFADSEIKIKKGSSTQAIDIGTTRGVRISSGGYGSLEPLNSVGASLGSGYNKWATVFATKLWNGANLAVPTEGGTLARLEDIPAADVTSVNTKKGDVVLTGADINATLTGTGDPVTATVTGHLQTLKNDETELGNQVSNIQALIPSDASETNLLATKADVPAGGQSWFKEFTYTRQEGPDDQQPLRLVFELPADISDGTYEFNSYATGLPQSDGEAPRPFTIKKRYTKFTVKDRNIINGITYFAQTDEQSYIGNTDAISTVGSFSIRKTESGPFFIISEPWDSASEVLVYGEYGVEYKTLGVSKVRNVVTGAEIEPQNIQQFAGWDLPEVYQNLPYLRGINREQLVSIPITPTNADDGIQSRIYGLAISNVSNNAETTDYNWSSGIQCFVKITNCPANDDGTRRYEGEYVFSISGTPCNTPYIKEERKSGTFADRIIRCGYVQGDTVTIYVEFEDKQVFANECYIMLSFYGSTFTPAILNNITSEGELPALSTVLETHVSEGTGGLTAVSHDDSLSGKGTETEPLSVARPAAIIREW